MERILDSPWGRLFRGWENLESDGKGYPSVGEQSARIGKAGLAAFTRSFKVLLTCMKEAPEFAQRRRMSSARKSRS